jgi:hypothetical protein
VIKALKNDFFAVQMEVCGIWKYANYGELKGKCDKHENFDII